MNIFLRTFSRDALASDDDLGIHSSRKQGRQQLEKSEVETYLARNGIFLSLANVVFEDKSYPGNNN